MRPLRFAVLAALSVAPQLELHGQSAPGRAVGAESFDAAVYADSATAALIAAARQHHRFRSEQIASYRAKVFTRAEARIGVGRFSRGLSMFTYESAATVHWQNPGDVRIDLQGVRTSTARLPMMQRDKLDGFWIESITSEPWFVPASLGDHIEMMGIPEEDALHPLARRGDRYYRYAISDSIEISLPGRTVRAIAVSVEPTYEGPTLLSGIMWLDADSLDVVRLTAAVVGDNIWENDEWTPRMQSMEIDLEYGLHLNRYWLPFRQIVTPTWTYRFIPGATMPSSAVTTFSDYEISEDSLVEFAPLPPSAERRRRRWDWNCDPWNVTTRRSRRDRCGREAYVTDDMDENGNRWEMVVPSLDSLRNFDFGTEFLVAEQSAAAELIRARIGDMAGLSEQISPQFAVQQQWLSRIDWGQVLQAFQYNRVQGASLGGGYTLRPGPDYTTVHARARFSFGDGRPTGSLTWRRDAPRGRLDVEAFRALRYAEPWTEGTPIGNSLKALFSGHDDADYHLALGGGISFRGYQGLLRDVEVGVRLERQRSMSVTTSSGINDFLFGRGVFQPNPPIVEGDFVRGHLARAYYAGRAAFRFGADALYGERLFGGRVWGSATVPYWLGSASGFVRVRGGAVAGDSLPQLLLRAGGPETVRGYTYGTRRGEGLWSVQWEQELRSSEIWAPVVFIDAGDAVTSAYEFDPLVGVGAGISGLNGWMRLDFSKGIRPSTSVRFDLLFRIPL